MHYIILAKSETKYCPWWPCFIFME